MLNVNLPSRVFSSSSLMAGEAVVREQSYDAWDDAAIQAEMARLQDSC